jgi:nucleotide-binding universal stress UspA family protein
MFRRILIPLDGSPHAEQALPLAKLFAARFQSSVVLFQAIEPFSKRAHEGGALAGDDLVELSRRQASQYLKTIGHSFPGGLAVEHEVGVGSAATAILELAESAHIDLIAMATHGRTGLQRWVYGSVADKVLSGARLPILFVRASEAPQAPVSIRRILVPLDSSTLAERALVVALQLAKTFDVEVALVRVCEPSAYLQDGIAAATSSAALDEAVRVTVEEYLTEKTQEVRSQGVRVRWETQFGVAAERILDAAQKQAASLVVMSTHGRSGIGRWILGSVADRVLCASRIPMLLIRSNAVVEGVDSAP